MFRRVPTPPHDHECFQVRYVTGTHWGIAPPHPQKETLLGKILSDIMDCE